MTGIGGMMGYGTANWGVYGISRLQRALPASQPSVPVQPVTPAPLVDRAAPGRKSTPADPSSWIRKGVDPVAMAVRSRIQYVQPGEEELSPRETMEEAECQTCKNRKYQDGSDDPGVSFQTPTKVAPENAASAVRGHEMEHVSRERAAAQRENRKVVQQSVTYHTAICPECGDVYVSGGTTRTTTKADNAQKLFQQPQEQPSPLFQATA